MLRNMKLKAGSTSRLAAGQTARTLPITSSRYSSTQAKAEEPITKDDKQAAKQELAVKKKKTMAELDEELKMKMEGIAGDGGEAGVELENGVPTAMKRGVRENMFRII